MSENNHPPSDQVPDAELANLETEARNDASNAIDELSALEIVRLISSQDALIAEAVAAESEPIAAAVEVIAERLRQGGRLIYIGAGTSGRLGVLDASECPPTFSTPAEMVVGLIAGGPQALTRAIEGAEDRPQDGARDLQSIQADAKDVVVGIATSGRTPYVIGGLQYAKQIGAFPIGLSCVRQSQLNVHCKIAITPIVGPEIVTGSTRMKAGTATKMVLNMLTTGAMIRLGKTYGNLMVDLTATNSKLLQRTQRIVCELTGLDAAQANRLLSLCDGELKTAIVSHMLGLDPAAARERLQDAGQHLRRALREGDRS